jgi:hypothetical protein
VENGGCDGGLATLGRLGVSWYLQSATPTESSLNCSDVVLILDQDADAISPTSSGLELAEFLSCAAAAVMTAIASKSNGGEHWMSRLVQSSF